MPTEMAGHSEQKAFDEALMAMPELDFSGFGPEWETVRQALEARGLTLERLEPDRVAGDGKG